MPSNTIPSDPNSLTGKRIIVGLSGGVDSAVAAFLLKEQGADLTGIFMKNWEGPDEACTAEEDHHEARLVADHLDIPLYAFNFSKDYWDRVFSRFLDEINRGLTPNPDILCNKEIKFKAFLEKALELDAEFIATGHYARTRDTPTGTELLKGRDPSKDQSYFLYAVPQAALKRALFPLGDWLKKDVRETARRTGLPNWNRKDSTGICFIGERNFRGFLEGYVGIRPGNIEDAEGNVVGRHQGLAFHTIGQRKGLGLGGAGAAWYVAGKDVARNVVIAVRGDDHPLLFASNLIMSEVTTISGRRLPDQFGCRAKIRYRQRDQAARIERIDADRFWVAFDKPQRAVTPGQSAVLYRGEVCLGGGVIQSAEVQAKGPASPAR